MSSVDIQHFSHQHTLESLRLSEGEEIECGFCEQDLAPAQPFHGCLDCEYYLHDTCSKTPRSLEHPSHPNHPLTFHLTPTYSSRSYTCNACASEGTGFSFSCAHCEFDVHIQCANLPTSVLTHKHTHQLKLIYRYPYSSSFKCDICRAKMDPSQWLYYCAGCDFASHTDCVESKPRVAKVKENKVKAKKTEASTQAQQGHFTPSAEDLNAVRKAEEELYAATVKYKLEAQGRQAALDLLDYPRRRYYY